MCCAYYANSIIGMASSYISTIIGNISSMYLFHNKGSHTDTLTVERSATMVKVKGQGVLSQWSKSKDKGCLVNGQGHYFRSMAHHISTLNRFSVQFYANIRRYTKLT